MVECLPNVSELSPDEKSELIVRLFAELQFLRDTVETLKNRIDVLETENKELRDEINELREENNELRGKLAKNSKKRLPNTIQHSRRLIFGPVRPAPAAGCGVT